MEDSTVTTEVLLSELKGLASAQSARFDGLEREQSTMREWLSRLSDAMDRQITVTSKIMGLETRQSYVEAEVSDFKLDIEDLHVAINEIQKDNIKTSIIRGALSALTGGAIGAAITAFLLKLLHLNPPI